MVLDFCSRKISKSKQKYKGNFKGVMILTKSNFLIKKEVDANAGIRPGQQLSFRKYGCSGN